MTPPTTPPTTSSQMVILVDDEDRENGDTTIVRGRDRHPNRSTSWRPTRGLICLAMDDTMIDASRLPMMVRDNQASLSTAFTVSTEARPACRPASRRAIARPRSGRRSPMTPAPPESSRRVTCSAARAQGRRAVRTGHRGLGRPPRARRACQPQICEIARTAMARRPSSGVRRKHGLLLPRRRHDRTGCCAGGSCPEGGRSMRPALGRASRSRRTTTTPRSGTPGTSRLSAAMSGVTPRPGPVRVARWIPRRSVHAGRI